MTEGQALALIHRALERVESGKSANVALTTNLTEQGILDSLDVMGFLFQIENELGKKLTSIDESHEDYRVSTLIELIRNA